MCARRWQLMMRPDGHVMGTGLMADAPRSPRLSGGSLKNVARLARTRVGSIALQKLLRSELRIDRLGLLPDELRGDVPLDTNAHPGRPPRTAANAGLPLP